MHIWRYLACQTRPSLQFSFYHLNIEFTTYSSLSFCFKLRTNLVKSIFSTSLEREYSLMALALEKHDDEEHHNTPREIMEWLERVRLMAKEQCFNK